MFFYLMRVKVDSLSCAGRVRVVFLTIAALLWSKYLRCSLGYPYFKIHMITSLRWCWSLITCFMKQLVISLWMGGWPFPFLWY